MLHLHLSATDTFEAVELTLEHSLVSLSKWESKYEKPFHNKDGMTHEQTLSYIEMMLTCASPHPNWIGRLEKEHYVRVLEYISSKQSATWFREDPNEKKSREIITSELIYYWMVSFRIPFEAQYWHLNRLMNLIQICGIKQTKPKKMSRAEQRAEMRRLNAERRERLGTTG